MVASCRYRYRFVPCRFLYRQRSDDAFVQDGRALDARKRRMNLGFRRRKPTEEKEFLYFVMVVDRCSGT